MSTLRLLTIVSMLFASLGGLGCATEEEDFSKPSVEEELVEEEAPREEPIAQAAGSCKVFTGFRSGQSARNYCYNYAWERELRVKSATAFSVPGIEDAPGGYAVACCLAR